MKDQVRALSRYIVWERITVYSTVRAVLIWKSVFRLVGARRDCVQRGTPIPEKSITLETLPRGWSRRSWSSYRETFFPFLHRQQPRKYCSKDCRFGQLVTFEERLFVGCTRVTATPIDEKERRKVYHVSALYAISYFGHVSFAGSRGHWPRRAKAGSSAFIGQSSGSIKTIWPTSLSRFGLRTTWISSTKGWVAVHIDFPHLVLDRSQTPHIL